MTPEFLIIHLSPFDTAEADRRVIIERGVAKAKVWFPEKFTRGNVVRIVTARTTIEQPWGDVTLVNDKGAWIAGIIGGRKGPSRQTP